MVEFYLAERTDTPVKFNSEVTEMDTKERLLAIRLMENLRKNPAYAQTLGVQVTMKKSD